LCRCRDQFRLRLVDASNDRLSEDCVSRPTGQANHTGHYRRDRRALSPSSTKRHLWPRFCQVLSRSLGSAQPLLVPSAVGLPLAACFQREAIRAYQASRTRNLYREKLDKARAFISIRLFVVRGPQPIFSDGHCHSASRTPTPGPGFRIHAPSALIVTLLTLASASSLFVVYCMIRGYRAKEGGNLLRAQRPRWLRRIF
jgi:hypothetical protein